MLAHAVKYITNYLSSGVDFYDSGAQENTSTYISIYIYYSIYIIYLYSPYFFIITIYLFHFVGEKAVRLEKKALKKLTSVRPRRNRPAVHTLQQLPTKQSKLNIDATIYFFPDFFLDKIIKLSLYFWPKLVVLPTSGTVGHSRPPNVKLRFPPAPHIDVKRR